MNLITITILLVFLMLWRPIWVPVIRYSTVPDTKFFGDSPSRKSCKYQSTCGVIDIKFPFGLNSECVYQLSCENNRTVLHLNSNKYYVEAIDYRFRWINITNPRVHKDNCSILQGYSPTEIHDNTTFSVRSTNLVVFLTCKYPVKSPLYVETIPCITSKDFSDSLVQPHSYALIGWDLVASDIEDSCSIHSVLAYGLVLMWPRHIRASLVIGQFFLEVLAQVGFIIGVRALVGFIILFAFVIYKCKRRHLSEYDTIEEYLQSQNNLMPIRYSYKEIKKMTNNFKDKLGKGGYGDVYKGKSRSGHLVAIKMLKEAKCNDMDFINEVATIGRIYHINVVRLVGFCATTSKRALVYDFMPNGSLDKFLFSEDPNVMPLSWERAHDIAVGVARGIAYLHQGCNMQILHFDIKPHNVLLDDNFVPKVSDFGLAKLYPRDKSAVTLTAAKGTLGYMAPELIYRKIGEVSYKADVYSFGQLLLAMVGRRKLNAFTDHSSRVYFSSWIYDKVHRGEDEDLDLGVTLEDEKDLVRKIIVVALWCVQWRPIDRPSMREVIEMLESDLKDLNLPPKPLYFPPDSPTREQSINQEDSGDSTFLLSESIALEIEQID